MGVILVGLALSLSGCGIHWRPDAKPEPAPSSPVTVAASDCLKEAAAELAKIARDTAGQCNQFKSQADAIDFESEKDKAALKAAFKKLTDAQDACFEKDEDENLIWDAEKARKMYEDTAKGFEKAAGGDDGRKQRD